jgi:precorrin-6A synthase
VRELFVIGIGAGDPEQVTVQAITALNRVDVFFVADKGAGKDDLVALRSEICRRYITEKPYRIVEVPDPERDRTDRVADTSGYQLAVDDWHERRTAKYEQIMLAELGPGQNPGFLVWGDPALYDSTIRIVERLRARGALDFDFQVIPAISSVQALAAAHRMVLNRIGEPIHITTGRRLRDGLPPGLDNVVVMLDGDLVCRTFTEPGLEIYWGAYLGTPDQLLVAGPLHEVIDQIAAVRTEARARKGWIMDTYLVRRPLPVPDQA